MSRVSVLIPVRPAPRNLIETIRSIKNQSCSDWEIVAILDRDSGQNEELLRREIDKSKIRFVQTNVQKIGFSASLNLGIEACSSTFVARQDDDDISSPDRLELQLSKFDSNPEAVLVTGWAKVVDTAGNHLYDIKQPHDIIAFSKLLIRRNIVPHSSAMFKREIVRSMGGYRHGLDGCEDYDLWLRLMSHGSLVSVQRTIVSYLKNPDGMTRVPLSMSKLLTIQRSQKSAQNATGINPFLGAISSWIFMIRQIVAQSFRSGR